MPPLIRWRADTLALHLGHQIKGWALRKQPARCSR